MEKQNTGLMVFVIILSIAVLGLGGFIVYDKVTVKSNNTDLSEKNNGINQEINYENNNTSGDAEENDTVKYVIPGDIKTYEVSLGKETCVNVNDNLGYPYQSGDYMININNIMLDNKTVNYKYVANENLEIEYFNDEVIKLKNNYELILTSVCNYKNYLLTVEGWEGDPSIKLINSDGNIVYENTSEFEYENGILYLTKINADSSDYNKGTYQEISIDLTKEIKEKVTKTNKFNCNDIKSMDEYEYKTAEEQRIQKFCEIGY